MPAADLICGPDPVTIIRDETLRYPHSVTFTPESNRLVVTNSGANYFSVYEPRHGILGMRWSQSPLVQKIVNDEDAFRRVNAENKMEGGPKGVAIHSDTVAVCSPEFGMKIYALAQAPVEKDRTAAARQGMTRSADPQ